MSEGHHCIADELELGLELGVLLGEPLPARAVGAVVGVEGGGGGAGVATGEVIFPEFCECNYILWRIECVDGIQITSLNIYTED